MPIAQPDITASLRPAGVAPGLTPENLIFVGQQTSGTAVTGALTENIGVNDADGLYGPDSPMAAAINRARRRNTETNFLGIGLDDNGGATAADGVVLFTGPATENGSQTHYIGSKKFNAYLLAITSGDSATEIGDLLVTAITADATALVTAINTTGSVALTAKSGGTFGNTIGIKTEGTVAGVTVAITAMANGATDPVLTGVFDPLGGLQVKGVAWQFTNSLSVLTDFLDARFNVTNDTLDGRGFVSITDTFANHLSTLSPLNSQSLSMITDPLISRATHRGPSIFDVPFTKAAEFAAIRALRRTEGATLGELVIARSARDAFGGVRLNTKPYANTPFPDLIIPDTGDSFTDAEIKQLSDPVTGVGGWVMDANRPGTAVVCGIVNTTYKTDPAGNPDPTWKTLNNVDSMTAAREIIVNDTRAAFPQFRAAVGALVTGVDSTNEASIATFITAKNQELGDQALVNIGVGTVDGVQVDFDKAFREALTVTLNNVTGKYLVSLKLFRLGQLRGVTYDLAVAFNV